MFFLLLLLIIIISHFNYYKNLYFDRWDGSERVLFYYQQL